MSQTLEQEFAPLPEDGAWARVFNYHPLDVEIERAEGVFIYDTKGNRYYDISGGPLGVNIGHGHPLIKAAIREQLDRYCSVHPTLANPRRAELCEALASVMPEGFATSYLVSGGSEAVETAIKIARQYHVATGKPGKHKVISCRESYHGMTLATMALSGQPGTLRHYDPVIPQWPKVNQYSDTNRPEGVSRDEWARAVAGELEQLIYYEGRGTVAAFVVTPHGCGSDYGLVAPKVYWEEVRRICDENDVLLIDDEVMSGFGRTGKWFATEHHGIEPDLITMGKGISSITVPLGAVGVSDKVNEPFAAGVGFVHGFTNSGNGLACAAGLATIEILQSENLIEAANIRGDQLFSHKERLLAHPSVADIRGWGLFMVLELVSSPERRIFFSRDAEAELKWQQIGLANGVTFYATLYGARSQSIGDRGLPMWICPPLTVTEDELDDMIDRVDRTLGHWERAMGIQV